MGFFKDNYKKNFVTNPLMFTALAIVLGLLAWGFWQLYGGVF